MHWNYRVIRKQYPLAKSLCPPGEEAFEYSFSIHEVYYNEDGTITGVSVDGMAAAGDTEVELREAYVQMAEAFNAPTLIYEEIEFVDRYTPGSCGDCGRPQCPECSEVDDAKL